MLSRQERRHARNECLATGLGSAPVLGNVTGGVSDSTGNPTAAQGSSQRRANDPHSAPLRRSRIRGLALERLSSSMETA
jgi:hypothetical protein